MMTVLGILVFAGAFAAAASVFAFTLVPALPRIAALLRGEADPAYVTAPMLILSDRRLRARVRPVSAMAIAARPQALRVAA
jgi:hypothetical protein